MTLCPSFAGTVQRRTCAECGIYKPSIAAKQRHQSFCQTIGSKGTDSDSMDDEESASDIAIEEEAPIFKISEIIKEYAFDEVA